MSKNPLSPYGISKAEIEAATKALTDNEKVALPTLPTFHFYNKSMELTEDMDKVPLEGHEFHKKSNKELQEIRQSVEAIIHYRMHGGKKLNEAKVKNEANMGGPLFTWNKDSKAFHNPEPPKSIISSKSKSTKKGFKTKYGRAGVGVGRFAKFATKEVKEAYGSPIFKGGAWSGYDSKLKSDEGSSYSKDAVDKEIKKDKRISGKEAKKIHAVLKGWRGNYK